MEWSEIRVKSPSDRPDMGHLLDHLMDAISSRLWELGVEGITELGDGSLTAYIQKDKISGLLPNLEQYLESMAELNPSLSQITFTTHEVPNTNWTEKYREYFTPRPLARFFYLVPEWVGGMEIPGGRIPIQMEAGEAFGTGLHPSTRLCLSLFERQGLTWPTPKQLRILDVGTGSGILGIAAEKFGSSDVTAIDNDPIAVEVAKDNAKKNKCSRFHVSATPLSELKGPYDVVLSNILLDVHRELFPHYSRVLGYDGRVIVSGLLGHQKSEIEEIAQENGFSVEAMQSLQEWAAFSFHRSRPCDS